MNPVEYIGLAGSILIFASFLFRDEIRIRAFNCVGSAVFIVYGVLLHAPSIWILNIATIVLQGYNILRLMYNKDL